MLLLTLLVLAQNEVSLSKAPGAPGECTGKTRRGDHGWVGLRRDGAAWQVKALQTRRDDRGQPYLGLCATEATWGEVAFKGVKPGVVEGVEVKADESTCTLEAAQLTLSGRRWSLTVKGAVATLASGDERLDVTLDSPCWTSGWLGDLDGDAKPDLLVGRVGGGFTFTLWLSSRKKLATVSGPAD